MAAPGGHLCVHLRLLEQKLFGYSVFRHRTSRVVGHKDLFGYSGTGAFVYPANCCVWVFGQRSTFGESGKQMYSVSRAKKLSGQSGTHLYSDGANICIRELDNGSVELGPATNMFAST